MNISVRFTILFIVLSSFQIYSQNYLPLFSDYLPGSVMNDKDFQNQVELNIQHYASVNPDLVYYYVKYLEKRFGEKVIDPDSNYYNLLREKDCVYRKARNTWVEEELKSADEISPRTFSIAVKRNLEELYQEDIKDYRSSIELNVDERMQLYFTYMILRGKKSQFNEKFNYASAVQKEMAQKIISFEEDYSNASGLDASKRYEMTDVSLKFPYVFKNGFVDKYKQSTDLRLYEFIREMLSEDYVRKNAVRAGIFYLKSDFRNSNSYSFTDNSFPVYHLENNDEVKIGTGIFIDLGFRLGLRKYGSPFSYIEIDGGYGISSGFTAENDLAPFTIQKDVYQPGTGTHTIVTYSLSEKNETSHYELFGRISTPVYYFHRNLFVEAGLNFFYTSVKRNCFDFSRQIDSIVSTNPDDFQEYRLNYSYEFQKGNLYPSIAFNYSLYEFLNIKAEYMIPVRLIAKMEVLFNF